MLSFVDNTYIENEIYKLPDAEKRKIYNRYQTVVRYNKYDYDNGYNFYQGIFGYIKPIKELETDAEYLWMQERYKKDCETPGINPEYLVSEKKYLDSIDKTKKYFICYDGFIVCFNTMDEIDKETEFYDLFLFRYVVEDILVYPELMDSMRLKSINKIKSAAFEKSRMQYKKAMQEKEEQKENELLETISIIIQ